MSICTTMAWSCSSPDIHIVSHFRHPYHYSPSSFSSSCCCCRRDVSVPATSRRLALIQLGTAIPQSQLFGVNASTLLNSDDVTSVATVEQPITEEKALDWSTKDNRKMLHVVYRVGDLERTIKFYTECLGMKVLRQRNIPEERYANAFLGYGPEESNFAIELTYNYGVDKYDIGNGFGHFGIAVEDIAKRVDLVKASKGGKVIMEPGPVKGGSGSGSTVIEDPDGYKFELLERKGRIREPLCQLMLRVGDIDRSIKFYQQAYGMELLRKTDFPEYKKSERKLAVTNGQVLKVDWLLIQANDRIVKEYTIAVMGYGSEDESAVLELTYNYGITDYDKGNGYGQIAIGTDDVYKTAQVVKLFGGDIVLEPGPLPVINTKITACLDPDGWKSVFVDNIDFLKELE